MKKLKTFTALGAIVIAVGAISFTAFAASTYSSPSQAVAGLTGRTEESVIAQRSETGDTYGTIAKEAGKLEEFKAEMLEIKKEALAARVKEGTMTQEQADAILKNLEENQALCDGTGSARIGRNSGAGFGRMSGQGLGKMNGQGFGKMNGQGRR